MKTVYVPNIAQPRVQDSQVCRGERGFDTTTSVVTTDDDVFDVQVADSVVDDCHYVEIVVADEVGDVAMHEDFASIKTHDFVGWNTGIGASYVSAKS